MVGPRGDASFDGSVLSDYLVISFFVTRSYVSIWDVSLLSGVGFYSRVSPLFIHGAHGLALAIS
jgi:hypothetical protein